MSYDPIPTLNGNNSTFNGDVTVNGTLSALSAVVTVMDIKQYELSGFTVQGNATVNGTVSSTGVIVDNAQIPGPNSNLKDAARFVGNYYGYPNSFSIGGYGFLCGAYGEWNPNNNATVAIQYDAGVVIGNGRPLQFTSGNTVFGNYYADVALYRDGVGRLAQRKGTNSQTFQQYLTYTDANNYQRGTFTWKQPNSAFVIGTETATTAGNSVLSGLVSPIIIAPGYNQSLSSTAPVILQQTWNNRNASFTILSANIINNDSVSPTSSPNNNNIISVTVNGETRFKLREWGALEVGSSSGPSNGDHIFRNQTGNNQGFRFDNVGSSDGFRYSYYGLSIYNNRFGFTSTSIGAVPDVSLSREGAGILSQVNSTNAQTFRLYNTYTDASNYERGYFRWSSNTLQIGAEGLGTGSNRDIAFQTANSTRMTITSGGNVGIGTSSPTHNLDVLGGYAGDVFRTRNGANNTSFYIQNVGGIAASHVSNGRFTLYGNQSTIISPEGNIAMPSNGIFRVHTSQYGGDTTLQIVTNHGSIVSGNQSIQFVSNFGGSADTAAGSVNAYIKNSMDNTIRFATASAIDIYGNSSGLREVVIFNGSGNVGINTTTPNEKLTVVGNISASGVYKQTVYTVATLPNAATSGAGARSFVSDALAPTFMATVVGSGAIPVPVYSDGTNWLVG